MSKRTSCEHLNKLYEVVAKELWQCTEAFQCMDCGSQGPNLWVCLQGDCLYIGCSENHKDHSTKHHKDKPHHCVHMNLTTTRVWCYECQREVSPSAIPYGGESFTSSQLGGSSHSVSGLKGFEDRLRTAGLHCSSFSLGGGDSQDSSDDDECQQDDGKPKGLVGLQNIGNTCYMNSAIQALSNTPPLTQYFLDCAPSVKFLTHTKKPGLSRSYQKLVREIWKRTNRGYVVPNKILYGIRNVHPMFRGYHQHDTQEFLRCFMDQLHEELKEPIREEPYSHHLTDSPFITRQPASSNSASDSQESKLNNSRVSEGYGTSRRLCRLQRSPVMMTDTVLSQTSKGYYRVHSQSESMGASVMPGHRCSSSYCDPRTYTPIPQDLTKDEFPYASPLGIDAEHESSERELEDDEEETYETCDSGVSDSASLSGEESLPLPKGYKRKSEPSPSGGGGGDRAPPPPPRFRSVISDVFDGRLLSSVQCLTCDRISTRIETFQDLSLPIPSRDHMAVLHGGGPSGAGAGGRGAACSDAVYSAATQEGWVWWLLSWLRSWLYGPAVTLHDCLAAFFSADELKGDNMYSCEKCNKLRNGVKFSKVLGLPEVLCVHLKRFRHELMSSSKIGAKVSFPLSGLDMQPYLHKECTSNVSTYDLVAVICHTGTAGGGHYTCVARNKEEGRWFEFDDQCVTGFTPEQVAACEAYVLFYKKSNPHMMSLRHKAIEIAEASCENEPKHYISKQWINRFNTYAEPGPIDNGDFLCPHGGVAPDRMRVVKDITAEVSHTLWDFYYRNFGGGPACGQLFLCSVCRAAADRLRQRQQVELERFTILNKNFHKQECMSAIFAISMSWFRCWEAFVRRKSQQPPPPIDNTGIALKASQDNPNSTKPACLKPGSDNTQINEETWRFFHGIYGGGPEIKLKSAVTSYSQPERSNSLSHSQGYSSASPNSRIQPSSYTTSSQDRDFNLDMGKSDSDDSYYPETTNVKSLSSVDLLNVEHRDGEVTLSNVKSTQSLQDVSVQHYPRSGSNTFINDRSNSHRASTDSDNQIVHNDSIEYASSKSSNSTIVNSCNHTMRNSSSTEINTRQNHKHKSGKGVKKANKSCNSSYEDNGIPFADSDREDGLTEPKKIVYNHSDRVNHSHDEDYEMKDVSRYNSSPKKSSTAAAAIVNDMHSVCSGMQAVSVEVDKKPEPASQPGSGKSRKNAKTSGRKLRRQSNSGSYKKAGSANQGESVCSNGGDRSAK